MKRKMQLVSLKGTGHVLLAFTREAGAELVIPIRDLVGDELVVRRAVDAATPLGVPPEFRVAADLLQLGVADFDPDVIHDPIGYVFGGGAISTFSTAVSSATLTPSTIDVTLSPAQDADVWAWVSERPPVGSRPLDRRVIFGRVSKGATPPVPLDLTLDPSGTKAGVTPGNHFDVMVLASGLQPFIANNVTA